MASNTLFITMDYLKRNSPIQNNTDDDLLKPIIALVQDKYIEPITGSELFNRLVSNIQSNTLSGDYLTLVERYIQPTIVQYCLAEGLEWICSQVTNKGLQNKSSDNSAPAEETRVVKLEDLSLQNANFYAERMIRYLQANYQLFPELRPTSADCATIFPQKNAYFSGINIPPIPYVDRKYRNRGDSDYYNCNW